MNPPRAYTSDPDAHRQQQQHAFASVPLPPPAVPPLRRAQLPQPPPTLRTTALAVHGHGHGNALLTPVSTTSLSTPFSLHGVASPLSASPAIAASPMALRSPASFAAAPYNPREWARGNDAVQLAQTHSTAQRVVYAPRMVGPDEPMASPPPPYSAQPTTSPDTASPATELSLSTMPSSATASISPGGPVATSGWERTTGASITSLASPNLVSAAFPPPPLPSSNSRNHAERLLQAMNLRSPIANATPPPNAIDALHHNTSQLIQIASANAGPSSAPGARRAASMGALDGAQPRASPSNNPVQDLGIVIPPPPPGPPPAVRSQSACRPSDTRGAYGPSLALNSHRQPVARGSDLGPVPPTPADWRDDASASNVSISSSDKYSPERPLRVQTENLTQTQLVQSPASGDSSGHPSGFTGGRPRKDSAGLMRSPAVRNRSAQGLRERRSLSRHAIHSDSQDPTEFAAVANDPLARPLKEIIVNSELNMQRHASTRVTPQSGRFRGIEDALTSNDSDYAVTAGGSSRSTPRRESSRPGKMPLNAASPANSPSAGQMPVSSLRSAQNPLNHGLVSETSGRVARPVSHILHIPNDDNVRMSPLRPESSQSHVEVDSPSTQKAFAARATERYRLFIQQEANASDDSERLFLFAQFMVAESQLRRERYATVFRDENVKIADLLEGMFEMADEDKPLAPDPAPPIRKDNATSMTGSRRSSGTSFADSSSHSRPVSASSTSEPLHLTLDTTVSDHRSKSFVPALSPIASMSAVTGRDEIDSRGRAPSRWWESQSASSQRGDGFEVIKRSKRESKYMSAVLENEALPSFNEIHQTDASASTQPPLYNYGPNEYPPEKVGLHEPAKTPVPQPPTPMSAPYTPDPQKLDISRLITLPPPYPRHYPAVNNSHPDLADLRGTVRALNELNDFSATHGKFEATFTEKRQRSDSWCQHQRSLHDQDIQFRIERGEITQQEYDASEAKLETQLGQAKKELTQQTFDLFQSIVVTPLHALVTERIQRADVAFGSLCTQLQSDRETHSPNLPQEAGDEKPELLEKLTMLKWLFEARETLYREKHKLLTERNEHYKAVILMPYELSGNKAKRAEVDSFFKSDARKRQAAADTAVLQRWKELLSTIETHVTKGVEVQLSAFWDIAPPLQALLQRIPAHDLRTFSILVPRSEVDENPSYWEHPLRYLYSVLVHAEASSRQFVESQVSLWCLLQEVREGCSGARWRARASQNREASDGLQGLDSRDQREQEAENRRGVDDLKERVGAVEGQWSEGLGGAITEVKDAVRGFLEYNGGWDAELENGGD